MATLNISYEEALDASNKIKSTANAMKDILDTTSNLIDKNIDNSEVWSGTDADSAKAEFNSYKKDFDEYYNLFLASAENISNSVTAIQQSETANKNKFGV